MKKLLSAILAGLFLIFSAAVVPVTIDTTVFAEKDSDEDENKSKKSKDSKDEEEDAEEAPSLGNGKYILYDIPSDTVMFSKNPGSKINPSGMVKILTAITVIENVDDLSKKVTVPDEILADYDYSNGNIGLSSGEKISYSDLLTAMIMKDAGDCAITLSHVTLKNKNEFIKKMNETAKKAGATDSVFTDAAGFDDRNQYSTLNDMLSISKYALNNPDFLKFAAVSSYEIPQTNKSENIRKIYNENYFLSRFYNANYLNENITFAKSSYPTENSGGMIVRYSGGANDFLILCTDCKYSSGINSAYSDVEYLIEDGKTNYTGVTFTQANEIIHEVALENGENSDRVLLVSENTLTKKLPLDHNPSGIERKINIHDNIKAPVQKGEVLGEMIVYYNSGEIARTNLIAYSSVDKSTSKYVMKKIHQFITSPLFITAFIILIAAIIGSMAYKNIKKNKK